MLKIQIIIGSTREGRRSEMVAKWIKSFTDKRNDATYEFIDLRDYPLPYFNEKGSPHMLKDEIPTAKIWREKVSEADGFIIISPEYNHGYPAVLKNALDYTYTAWRRKPVGIVSYGSLGGARATEQLRTVAIELEMAPIEPAVNLIKPRELFDENGDMKIDSYDSSVTRMFDDLIWWANALQIARKTSS